MPEPIRAHHGLTEILIEAGVVSAGQVQAGLARQRETGLRIGETLVEIGAATEEDIGWALARQLGLPFVDLQSQTLDTELLDRFQAGALYRMQAVPLLRSEEGLSVALSDPTDRKLAAHLEMLAGCAVLPSVATPSAIRRVLAPRLGVHGSAAAARPGAITLGGDVVWDRSGANFLHFHLHSALETGASAIHFVPEPHGLRVYHRLPGGVALVANESPEVFEALLTQLELLDAPVGAMTAELQRKAHVACSTSRGMVRFEVVLLALDGGTSVTLRLAATSGAPRTLDALGLEPLDTACVRDVLHRPAGLVLVSGPAGSGRTTTLACLLAESLREDRSAMVFGSLPLPGPESGLAFALPSPEARLAWEDLVTAHEPDVVVLDDLAAGLSVEPLASSAGMGRLVLASSDWADTFALLELIAAQPHCGPVLASRLHLVVQQRSVSLAAGGACARFEVLVISDAMRAAIRARSSAAKLRSLAETEGFRSLARVLDEDLQANRIAPAAVARALTA